jgi:NADH-quinone oxidoreductase subunit M
MLQSFTEHIVSWLVFLPLLGATCLYIIPALWPKVDPEGERSRVFAVVFSSAVFALSLLLLKGFDPANPGFQFVERYPWISEFGISYAVGVDGISLWLILLTTFLMPIIFVASASVHSMRRGYICSMFVLQSSMVGTLVATDLFLFYVFWELMLAPMYFIIGIWGGARRVYATLKFVLYTVFGSVLMLVAILFVVWRYYDQTHLITFDLLTLLDGTNLTLKEELWLFAAFALAFGIKVPIFPFHTWLPDAHVEAPTGGSVVLAGVLLKMGIYGFLRFAYPLFPRGAEYFGVWLAGLAVVGIVYGALVAWAQTDIKKLVAYSSVSHLGYCVLGLAAFNSVSTAGSIYQMLNHGISTGALFLLVGVLYDQRHTRLISEYGGLAGKVPVFAFLFLVFTLSSIALPLTNGFIGEFMILAGSFKTFPWLTVIAGTGVILGAIYMLTLYMKTMFGELDISKNGSLTDVNFRELATFVPLLVMVFWMGLFPQPFLDRMEPTINSYLSAVKERSERLQGNESGIPQEGQGGSESPATLAALDSANKEISREQPL